MGVLNCDGLDGGSRFGVVLVDKRNRRVVEVDWIRIEFGPGFEEVGDEGWCVCVGLEHVFLCVGRGEEEGDGVADVCIVQEWETGVSVDGVNEVRGPGWKLF